MGKKDKAESLLKVKMKNINFLRVFCIMTIIMSEKCLKISCFSYFFCENA